MGDGRLRLKVTVLRDLHNCIVAGPTPLTVVYFSFRLTETIGVNNVEFSDDTHRTSGAFKVCASDLESGFEQPTSDDRRQRLLK